MEQKQKFRIGVMGSSGRNKPLPDELLVKAREIGKEIAKTDCVLITGACMGVPQSATIGATEQGGLVFGFSPAANIKEHLAPPLNYPAPAGSAYLIFTGFGKEGRNVLSLRNCDAVIFIAGSAGTLTEFALAYHMGKVIGVLEGTGGIADKIPEIIKDIDKNTDAVLITDKDPKNLIEKIIEALRKQIYG